MSAGDLRAAQLQRARGGLFCGRDNVSGSSVGLASSPAVAGVVGHPPWWHLGGAGLQDELITPASGRLSANRIPGARVVELEEASLWLMTDSLWLTTDSLWLMTDSLFAYLLSLNEHLRRNLAA